MGSGGYHKEGLVAGFVLMPDNGKEAFADALGVESKRPRERRRKMTDEIVPADFPGLASLCWNRNPARPIDRDIAWSLYRANWRFIYQDELTADEIALIESLEVEFGNGERLLGTEGPPPPMAGRVITPEHAAEILGIDLVLLERRVRAGRLSRRELGGKITFSLADVLALKKDEDRRNALMVEIYDDMDGIDKPPNEPGRKM